MNKMPGINPISLDAITYCYGDDNEIYYNLESETIRIIIVKDGHEQQNIVKALSELRRRGILPA